jgi:hypothetical protein
VEGQDEEEIRKRKETKKNRVIADILTSTKNKIAFLHNLIRRMKESDGLLGFCSTLKMEVTCT